MQSAEAFKILCNIEQQKFGSESSCEAYSSFNQKMFRAVKISLHYPLAKKLLSFKRSDVTGSM